MASAWKDRIGGCHRTMMLLCCSWISARSNTFQGHQVDIKDHLFHFVSFSFILFLVLLLCSLSNLPCSWLLWLEPCTSFHNYSTSSQSFRAKAAEFGQSLKMFQANSENLFHIEVVPSRDVSWCPMDSASQGFCSTLARAERAGFGECAKHMQSAYSAMHCDILSIFVPKWGSYKKSFMYDYTSLWDFIGKTFLEQHAHQVLGLIVLCSDSYLKARLSRGMSSTRGQDLISGWKMLK